MPCLLAISSFVARGHVGLSAALPALQRLGHEVIALPTVVLSNHLGHARAAGLTMPAETLAEMIEAYEAAGWLGTVDGVLSGYLPTPQHVQLVAETVARIRSRRPDVIFLCDPVLGDDPGGLYVHSRTAEAVRDTLIPFADIATPNRFELAWLSGLAVDTAKDAIEAARGLRTGTTLATSIPDTSGQALTNVLHSTEGSLTASVERLEGVPHGTGDLLAALFLSHLMNGLGRADAFERAVGAVERVARASLGADELNLAGTQDLWVSLEPERAPRTGTE